MGRTFRKKERENHRKKNKGKNSLKKNTCNEYYEEEEQYLGYGSKERDDGKRFVERRK